MQALFLIKLKDELVGNYCASEYYFCRTYSMIKGAYLVISAGKKRTDMIIEAEDIECKFTSFPDEKGRYIGMTMYELGVMNDQLL